MVSEINPQHRVAIMRREMLEVLELLRAYERSNSGQVSSSINPAAMNVSTADVRVVHAREKLEAMQEVLFPVKETKDEIPG